MPIYEYQCERCGHQLEALQAVSEKALKECPACHEMALNKLISAVSFQLKGTGWYATDFRDKGKPQESKTNQTTCAANDAKTDTKTDTKASTDTNSTGSSTTKTDQGTGTL